MRHIVPGCLFWCLDVIYLAAELYTFLWLCIPFPFPFQRIRRCRHLNTHQGTAIDGWMGCVECEIPDDPSADVAALSVFCVLLPGDRKGYKEPQ